MNTGSSTGTGRSRKPACVAMAVVVILCLVLLRSRYTVDESNAVPKRLLVSHGGAEGLTPVDPNSADQLQGKRVASGQSDRPESVGPTIVSPLPTPLQETPVSDPSTSAVVPQTPEGTTAAQSAATDIPLTEPLTPISTLQPTTTATTVEPPSPVAPTPSPIEPTTPGPELPPTPPPLTIPTTAEVPSTTLIASGVDSLSPRTTTTKTDASWVTEVPATPTSPITTVGTDPIPSTTAADLKTELPPTTTTTASAVTNETSMLNPPVTEVAPTTTLSTQAPTSPAPSYVRGFYVNTHLHLVCNWEQKDSAWLGSSWGVVGTTVDCGNTAYTENYLSSDQCRLAPDYNITDVVFQVWPERPFSLAVALGIANGTVTPLLIRRSNKLFMHWDQQRYDPWGVRRHLQSATSDVMVPFREGESLAHLEKNSEPMEALYLKHPVVLYALETWLHFPSHTTEDYLDLLWYYLSRGLEKAKIPWLIPDAGTSRMYYSIVTFLSKLYGFDFVMIRPELIHRFRGTVLFPPVYHASVCGSLDTGLRLADYAVESKNASLNGTMKLHRGTCTVKLTGKVASATGSAGVAGGEPFLNLLAKSGITFLNGKESWEEKITTIHTGDLLICSWGASCFLNMIFRPKRLLVILSSGYQAEWLRVLQVRFGENQTTWPTNFVHSFTDVPAGGYFHARYIRTDNVDILTEEDLNF